METFKLDNGSLLVKDFGKYSSNLCFLGTEELTSEGRTRLPWSIVDWDLNVPVRPMYIRGEFFVSKKGSNCFRINKNGAHVLLQYDWGGAFSKTRASDLAQYVRDSLYSRNASSNGGGSGVYYVIVPVGWQCHLSEDDI